MKQITQALTAVMAAVQNVEKNKTVGLGNNSYKGVEDKDVKVAIRGAMVQNGLAMVPIAIEPNVRIERWEETYGGQTKPKQSVMTEVKVTYRVLHTSGEYIDIVGYGHGIDTQDKSAGKATTYALKYALLYTFLIPTGSIDDADNENATPARPVSKPTPGADRLEEPKLIPLKKDDENWPRVIAYLQSNAGSGDAATTASLLLQLSRKYSWTPAVEKTLRNIIEVSAKAAE